MLLRFTETNLQDNETIDAWRPASIQWDWRQALKDADAEDERKRIERVKLWDARRRDGKIVRKDDRGQA